MFGLTNPYVQLTMWLIAAIVSFQFKNLMDGSGDTWTYISAGILLYGVRVGYKLLPFAKSTMVLRYIIGIVGISLLFIGVIKYHYNNLKMLLEVM